MTALEFPPDVDQFLGEETEPDWLSFTFSPLTLDHLKRVLASENARRLRSVSIYGDAGDEAMMLLAEASSLTGLAELTIWSWGTGEVTPAGLRALTATRWRLESLSLNRNRQLADEGLRVLSRANWATSLKRLEACSIRATADGAGDFLACAELPRLERLALGTDQVRATDPEDAIGDRGVFAIARATLPALTQLKVTGARITDAGARALAEWAGLARITNLDLSGNAITTAGLDALLASPNARAIQALGIGSNPCGPSYWTATDYDGSITASGVEDQTALQRVTEYVVRRLGRAVDVW